MHIPSSLDCHDRILDTQKTTFPSKHRNKDTLLKTRTLLLS